MRVRIDGAAGSGANTFYRVHVITPGSPIFVVATRRVRSAALEVDGVVVERAGFEASIALQPLGPSRATLRLSDLSPRDRVVIRITGDPGELKIIDDTSLLTAAAQNGLLSGFYFAFLLLIGLFNVLQSTKSNDRTNLWYAGWVLGMAADTAGRDGYFGPSVGVGLRLPLMDAAIGVGILGFVTCYLRLLVDAPRLFWIAAALNAIGNYTPVVAIAVVPNVAPAVFMMGPVLSLVPLLAIAILRWRAGFAPAGILIIGLTMLCGTVVIQLLLTVYAVDSPLRDEWVLHLAATWDLTVFAVALALRQRYRAHEREALEAELHRTAFEATHDELTGLLNRRGFDKWLLASGEKIGTLFFIDLDGFKAINDRGGHAAGDDTLRVVSRIIRHNVRESDAVVRIGGDEFVLAFAGAQADAQIAKARARISAAVSALEPLGARDAVRIGASIGVCSMSANMSIDEALRRADADAYRVKLEHYARRRASAGDPSGAARTSR